MGAFPDDELVRHARALRGLARALVGVQEADDLVQDTAAHVLARTPGDVRSWFQWFGGVMRKRAAKLHRGEGRRVLRERRGRGDEAGASESALRVAAHRETIARLDAALLALPEPYQAALILRYFEDLTPNEIAARTGDPVATVKSRLQRGLGLLRAARGRWFLLVRAADEVLAPSPFVPVQLLDGRTATVTVELAPWQLRRLVVTDGRDTVPGVHVELLDPGDVVLRRDTLTTTLEDARYGGPPMARILATGDTDAGGALELRGPRGPLALRLSGGGLSIHVVQPIRLDEPGELRLAVPRGAEWRGRLVPAEVSQQLFALGQPAAGVEAQEVGIELFGENGSLRRHGERLVPFAADGSFVIADIPPGTWNAVVHAQSRYAAAVITVAPGQRIEQDIDVRAMAIADVVLTVRVAGELQRNTLFCAIGSHGTDALGHRFASGTNKRSDADGRLSFRTFAGVVLLHVYWRSADLSSVLQTAVVVRGAGPQQIDVALEIGALDLTVLTPEGVPAADLECELAPSGARGGSARTDASGAMRRAVMAAGSYDLRVRPRSLRTAEAQSAFAGANGWPAMEEAWVDAGTIQVGAGVAVPQTVRLPASWNR